MPSNQISKDAVLLRFKEPMPSADSESFAKHVKNFGFTGLIAENSGIDGLEIISPGEISLLNIEEAFSVDLQSIADGRQPTSESVWSSHESINNPGPVTELDVTTSDLRSLGAVSLLHQMSMPHVPIVDFGRAPQSLPRDHAHFVRSLVFWRNRNGIARMEPKLVHAGDDGTLVYILGSWLVALNWNIEEISIDVGDTGTMWLMLGTPLDVHLHGSLLVLPAYSGAILANELAK